MFSHRVLALLGFSFVLWTMIRARAMARRSRPLVVLSTLAFALFCAQIASGAANVSTRLKPWAVVAHVALSVLIWATLVALATVASLRPGTPARAAPPTPISSAASDAAPAGRSVVRRTPSPPTTGSRSPASSSCC